MNIVENIESHVVMYEDNAHNQPPLVITLEAIEEALRHLRVCTAPSLELESSGWGR